MTLSAAAQAVRPVVSSLRDNVDQPVGLSLKQRNAVLDWLFYDVTALTLSEFLKLNAQIDRIGSILVVRPGDDVNEERVVRYEDYVALKNAPGRMLSRFTIAGVGSSNVGAAAFARNVADHYGEPVGAIVAGYGVADVLAEALGGWFFFGTANRLMQQFHGLQDFMRRMAEYAASKGQFAASATKAPLLPSPDEALKVATSDEGRTVTETLMRLLQDEDRTITTLVGHSKGCLNMAYALESLAISPTVSADAKAKARRINLITAGTVVEFPRGFDSAAQFLGEIDWFGGMNSRTGEKFETWPRAFHHLNTKFFNHMPMRDVLRRADEIARSR